MTPGLVSCILPAYNSGRFIREALDSIAAQSYRPLEVIVADGGSTDETATIVSAFPEAVSYHRQNNSGPAATRNLGIKHATGEFIAFLDPDDLWHPDKVSMQVQLLTDRPDLGYCLTSVQMFWDESAREEAEAFRDHPRAQPVAGYATTTLLARRETFDQVGLFDESLWSTDAVDWFDRAGARGICSELLPDVLVFRRMHDNNMTRRLSREFREEWLRYLRKKLDAQRQHE